MAEAEPSRSTQIILNLEEEAGYPQGSLKKKGFKSFFGRDLEEIPSSDIETVINTIKPFLEKTMEIAKERKQRRLSRPGYVSDRTRRRKPVPTKREVEQAMLFARQELLSSRTISDKTREFIEDHCACL